MTDTERVAEIKELLSEIREDFHATLDRMRENQSRNLTLSIMHEQRIKLLEFLMERLRRIIR